MKDLPHQFEFAVWWNEADTPIGVKVVETDTLMEAAVIQLDGIAHALLALVDNELVVKTKFAFGGTRQVGAHLDVAINVGA